MTIWKKMIPWHKEDRGTALGLVLVFVTILGVWLGAILLITQASTTGVQRIGVQNNNANQVSTATASVLAQLAANPAYGSAAYTSALQPNCGLPTSVSTATGSVQVICAPVTGATQQLTNTSIISTGTGTTAPGIDNGVLAVGSNTFNSPIQVLGSNSNAVTVNTGSNGTKQISVPIVYSPSGSLTIPNSGTQPVQKPNSVAPTTDPSTQVPAGQTSNTCATDNTCGTPGTPAGPTSYTYTISFNANGGSGTMNQQTGSASSVVLPTNTFTRSSYTFQGWSKSSGSSIVAYKNSDTVNLTANTTMTLYAVWLKSGSSGGNTYDAYVNYYPNGGTGSSQQVKYSGVTSFTLSSISNLGYLKSGYVFNGWATTSGGTPSYADSAPVQLSGDVTLNFYATWAAKAPSNVNPPSGNGGYKKDMPTTCSGLDAGIHFTAGAWNNQAIDQLNQLMQNEVIRTYSSDSTYSDKDCSGDNSWSHKIDISFDRGEIHFTGNTELDIKKKASDSRETISLHNESSDADAHYTNGKFDGCTYKHGVMGSSPKTISDWSGTQIVFSDSARIHNEDGQFTLCGPNSSNGRRYAMMSFDSSHVSACKARWGSTACPNVHTSGSYIYKAEGNSTSKSQIWGTIYSSDSRVEITQSSSGQHEVDGGVIAVAASVTCTASSSCSFPVKSGDAATGRVLKLTLVNTDGTRSDHLIYINDGSGLTPSARFTVTNTGK